jgi:hypothetical protein
MPDQDVAITTRRRARRDERRPSFRDQQSDQGDAPTTSVSSRNRRSWHEHAIEVSACWRRTIQDYFDTGDALEQAFKELEPADYKLMLAEVGIAESEARKLRIIAKKAVLRLHANALPRDYTSIYFLTPISDQRLEVLIEDGEINSAMPRWKAESLKLDECGDDDPYRPTPPIARRARSAAVPAETTDEDETESQEAVGSTAPAPDDANEAEQIARDADDIGEKLPEVLHSIRRPIERVRQHGDRTVRGMVANQLREHAASITRLANELAPEDQE